MPKTKSNKSSVKRGPALPRRDTSEFFNIQDDLRTVRRAGEITSDKKRMAQVKRLAATEEKAMKKITKK